METSVASIDPCVVLHMGTFIPRLGTRACPELLGMPYRNFDEAAASILDSTDNWPDKDVPDMMLSPYDILDRLQTHHSNPILQDWEVVRLMDYELRVQEERKDMPFKAAAIVTGPGWDHHEYGFNAAAIAAFALARIPWPTYAKPGETPYHAYLRAAPILELKGFAIESALNYYEVLP